MKRGRRYPETVRFSDDVEVVTISRATIIRSTCFYQHSSSCLVMTPSGYKKAVVAFFSDYAHLG
jgi:hypothetical protein